MKILVKKSKIFHISFAILLVYCVQFSINTFISFTQFSKKWIASIRSGESMGIAARKGFLAMKESEYKRDGVFVHKATAATPSCNFTSPAAGDVSGVVNVTATPDITSQNTVVGIQFKLDGVNLGAQDTTSPYQISWDTTGSSNGSHTLTCRITIQAAVSPSGTYTNNRSGLPVVVNVLNAVADIIPPASPNSLNVM